MKKLMYVAGILAIVGQVACSAGKKMNVKLEDVDKSLSKYEAVAEINILKEKKVISYTQVEMPKYDKFFKDSAVLLATVEVTKALIAYAENAIAKSDKDAIAKAKETLELLKGPLAGLVTTGKSLVEQGQALVGSASADFAGPNALKLGGVMSGLKEAIGSVKTAIDEVPDLISKIADLLPKLV